MADGRKYQWLESVMGSQLSNKTKCVGWALFKHANTKTLYCYPNLTRIDLVLGGSGSGKNMHRHIQSLLVSGFIVKHQKKVGHYMSNGYLLVTPNPPDDQGEPRDEEGGPQGDLGGIQGDGLTLSRTLSDNSFTNSFNEKPSASEIQEEIKKMGESFFSAGCVGSSDSDSRQLAASPPPAETEDEDLVSYMNSLFGTPSRQNAASPHVAAIQEPALREVDEIPNEEW